MDLKKQYNDGKSKLDKVLDAVADAQYKETFREIVTFDDCLVFLGNNRKSYPQVFGFVISVQKNPDPQNENDKLVIIQALIDQNNKPITLDGKTGLSRILHTKTIDSKLINFLDGSETKMYKIK